MSYITQAKEIDKQTKGKETPVKGVNVTNLYKSEEAIRQNDRLAKFSFRGKGKWINGAHNQVTINDFYGACHTIGRSPPFVYEGDEPQVQLAEDYGANPVEYTLTVLNSCLMTILVYLESDQGVKIDGT